MKKILTMAVSCVAIAVPVFVFAETTCVSGTLCNPIKYDTFSDFVSGVTQAAVNVLLPFVVLSFIYTGFLFVKAQGKPAEIEAAQKALWYSAIGALILFGAYGFSQVIKTTVETVTGTSNSTK